MPDKIFNVSWIPSSRVSHTGLSTSQHPRGLLSSSPIKHLQDIDRVFSILAENGLIVKRSKYVLGVPVLDFLGYRVDATGSKPLEDRVSAIHQFAPPTSVKVLWVTQMETICEENLSSL